MKRLFSFLRRKQDKQQSPIAQQEELDLRVWRRILPRKLPSWGQLLYIPKVLEKKERRLLAVSLCLFVLSVLALSVRAYVHDRITVPAVGGTYAEGLIGAPRFINPLLALANDADRDISALVFAGLFRNDMRGQITTDLAESFTVSEDERMYTVRLKSGLRWHDGEPLTAEDVLFTIQSIQDPAMKSPLRVTFSGVTINQIDERTVTFTLREPFPSFLSALTLGIMPSHVWYSIPTQQAHLAEANVKPVGSGPYRFKSLTKDASGGIRNLTLERYEEFHGRKPFIREIIFKFYPDISAAIEALQNKNVDGLSFVPLDRAQELEKTSGLILYTLNVPQYKALFFNPEHSDALKDKNVRRALAAAIDRTRLVEEVLGANGAAMAAPVVRGSNVTPSNTPKYDAAEAAKLLEENNWKLNEQSAVRAKDDTQLKIKITTTEQAENIAAAQIIKANWEAIGVAADIESVSRLKIKRDVIEPRGYEVLLFGQIAASAQDLYAFWHSSQIRHPGNNLSVFANKDVDLSLEAMRETTDAAQRDEHLTLFSEKLLGEAFAIFLYAPVYLYSVRDTVKGIDESTSITLPSDRFLGIADWYIKTSSKKQ